MGNGYLPPLPPVQPAKAVIRANAPRIRRQNSVALRFVAWIILFSIMLLAGLGIAGLATSELGIGTTIGAAILAFLPIPIYAGLILWLDRIEGEPPLMLLAAFMWGATVSVFLAYRTNTLFSSVVAAGTGSAEIADVGGAILSAPIVEELLKSGILFLFLFVKREIDGPLDGLVYGSMSGLGFAMSENIFYYGREMQHGLTETMIIFVLRGLLFALSHPLFTTFTGIGIAMSVRARTYTAKLVWICGGLCCAMFAHFFWNSTATFGGDEAAGMLLKVMGIGIPFMLLVASITLLMERRVLRKHLAVDAQMGILDPDTLKWAMSLSRRLIPFALLSYPAEYRPTLKQLMRVAAELAFSRERAMHSSGASLQEEIQFQQILWEELRAYAEVLRTRRG